MFSKLAAGSENELKKFKKTDLHPICFLNFLSEYLKNFWANEKL